MLKKAVVLMWCFIIGVLSGCAAVPTIELAKITKPEDLKGNEIDAFFLRKSTITIDKTGTKKNAEGKEVDDLGIVSIPEEYTQFKIGIRRADQAGVRTNLQITKTSNTELIEKAGVEVTDKRVEIITKIGTIIVKAAPVFFEVEKGLDPAMLPKKINVNVLLEGNRVGRESKAGIDASDGITIDFGPISPDARAIDEFSTPMVLNGLIYSACRSATVRFLYKANRYEKTLKINDPHFFQTISFPIKGNVSFHNECGVSVSSEDKDIGLLTTVDIIEALAIQGKAIKDAIDAAKKEEKKDEKKEDK